MTNPQSDAPPRKSTQRSDSPTAPPAESALAENNMECWPLMTPSEWTLNRWNFLTAIAVITRQRWKFAVCVPIVIGIIGALFFGFKSAGSYDGYTAGSILSPDSYTDYGTGSIRESFGLMSADQLNRILAGMRGKNMPGFIGWILVTLAAIALLAILSMAYDRSVSTTASMLTNDDDMYRFFRDQYEVEHGKYTPPFMDDKVNLPYTIAEYSYEWLLRPGMLSQWEQAPISETYKSAVYRQARTPFGRLYLLYNDLWFDGSTTTAKRIFGSFMGNGMPTFPSTPVSRPTPSPSPAPSPTPQPAAPTTVPAQPATPAEPETTETATTPTAPPMTMPPVPLPEPTTPPTDATPMPMTDTTLVSKDYKFCGQCGARLKRDARFCTQCGNPCRV